MSDTVGYVTAGFDQYGGGQREVTVDHDEHHVTLSVEGESRLTPGQARMVAAWLIAHARMADALSEVGNGV